jgi:hypothetical protein
MLFSWNSLITLLVDQHYSVSIYAWIAYAITQMMQLK